MRAVPTALPFDQYQRYRISALMIGAFRGSSEGSPLRILDVGGFFRLINRQVIYPIVLFSPGDQTITVDLEHHRPDERDPSTQGRLYVEGSGVRLPFAEASFDVVVSCDTLEHIPPEQRADFLDELARVSVDGIIVGAPFFEPATRLAEDLVLEYIRQQFGYEQPQLAEHRANGLPEKEDMRSWLDERRMTYVEFPSGYLDHWLVMMLLKSHLFAQPHLSNLHSLVDQYYNLRLFEADQRSPAYRHFFVASKTQDPTAFVNAAEALIPSAADDDKIESSLVAGLWEVIRLADRWSPIPQSGTSSAELAHLRRVVAAAVPPVRADDFDPDRGRDLKPSGTGILLIAPDTIGPMMAGPGIRYRELARALARRGLQVTLATPNDDPPVIEGVTVRSVCERSQISRLVSQHSVTILQGFALVKYPDLARACWNAGGYLVVDLYGPFHLENVERASSRPIADQLREYFFSYSVLGEQLRLADFFICASERQRDYWLGVLSGYYRVNPHTYDDDKSLRRLIDVVPFGLTDAAPRARRAVLRGVHADVDEADKLILWTGGLWDWLDPDTLIRAVSQITASRTDVKLFFARYPEGQASMPRWETQERAIALCKELGVYEKSVFFMPWVPFDRWLDYLHEADLAVSLHGSHTLESRFAFRTRHLDCIAAGLPMIVTRGDVLSDLITEYDLGKTVEPGDVEGLCAALLDLLGESDPRGSRAEGFTQVKTLYTWDRVVEPLAGYCRSPWRAADLASGLYQPWLSTMWDQIVRDAANSERALGRCQAQLAERDRLIEDIMQGKVMRLMTGIQRRLRHLGDVGQG